VSTVEPLDEENVRDLRIALREQRTLADVLSWLRALVPSRSVDAIITQDEYTHDVVVRYDEHRWLVFDTN
jgi:hypothetical protein